MQLAVKAELPGKATPEEVKSGMQRDLVVQLWSMKGTGPLSKWECATAVHLK